MQDLHLYAFEIRPLAAEEGGGYLISFPDFSECIADGESVEEAIQNGMDALQETIAALESLGLPVPEPGSGSTYSGKFIQRVPKSLHARLSLRARQEGVSMNTLVNTMLAENLGRRERVTES
jgi:antitoxin HicB